MFLDREFLFILDPYQNARMIFGMNPFTEAIKVAEYINEQGGPPLPILVLGSEPEIYFYTGRRAATGHIYMYPLYEDQPYAVQMQKELVSESETAAPSMHLCAITHVMDDAARAADTTVENWMREYVP